MSDLINRQAAIEHLYGRLIESANNNVGVWEDAGIVFEEIATERLKRWINEIPTIDPVRWIPVSERLPEEYTRVIGYMAWKAMTAIEYQHGRWYSIDHLVPLPDEAVSHWMPLPKPPKEKRDDTD